MGRASEKIDVIRTLCFLQIGIERESLKKLIRHGKIKNNMNQGTSGVASVKVVWLLKGIKIFHLLPIQFTRRKIKIENTIFFL